VTEVSPWRVTARPAELSIGCSGERHRLIWANGEVHLPDHPDRDAELALVGLGGPEPNCIAHMRLFEDAVRDGGFLAEWADDSGLTQAWYSWLDMALERMRTEGFHEVLRALPQERSLRMGEFISRFPLAWLDRAGAAVAEQVVGTDAGQGPGVVCEDAEANVLHAIRVRARRAFVTSVGAIHLTVGGAALVPLRVQITTTTAPSAEGHLAGPQRGAVLTLNPTWLHEVWAAGAATIENRLIVDLRPDPTDLHRATATWVDWSPTGPATTPAPSQGPMLQQAPVRHTDSGWAF